jgi:glutamine amidotransferase
VARADALVVPGDGAFADAMESLDRLGLTDPIRAHIAAGRPYLGICLGYQLLFTESEEFGHAKGFDVLPGVVRRFPAGLRALKVPHMGWNQLWHDGSLPLLAGIPAGAYFYFVHSYYPETPTALTDDVQTAHCEYGIRFPALLVRGQLYGTQFHPEKSQRWGLRLLANFAGLAGGRGSARA